MAERNKLFQSVTFHLRDGNTITAEDNQSTKKMFATSAIQQFKNNVLVELPAPTTGTIFVYPHSVSYIVVTKSIVTEEYSDDVCVEA